MKKMKDKRRAERNIDTNYEKTASEDVYPRFEDGTDEYVDMETVITALFDRISNAQNAVTELTSHGVAKENISVVSNDTAHEIEGEDTMNAASGAIVGGLGGLVVGLAALAIPGIGPIIAAGPIAAALVGAGAGSVTGGLLGALMDMGLSEEEAEYYAEGLRRGGTLVTVQTDDNMADEIIEIIERHNPIDVEERADEWYESGWMGYDPEAAPYTPEVIEQSRDRHAGEQNIEFNQAVGKN